MNASPADRFAALDGAQRIRLLRRLVELGRLDEIPAVVPPRGTGPVRLSPAQEDLWVHDALHPGSPALNLCCAYHFDRPVEVADLEAALAAVLARHDTLRTRITGDGDERRVEFAPCEDFRLEREDLRGGTATLREALSAFARRPFDLRRDPLIRGRVITVDGGRTTLVLALHHIATDWWSFDVLHAEFTRAYRAIRAGTPPERDRPGIQYADFAGWQWELAAAGVFDARLAFWREYLADPPAPLAVGPVGAAGPPGAGGGDHGIGRVPFHVDAPTEAAVRAYAREHGATVYAVLMTAFAVLAHRLTGRTDFVLGTPTANRTAKGLEQVIGYVMNAVPTRWRIGPRDGFADLVGRFTADFRRVLANADVPVGRIVSAVDPERVPGRSPLFQWVFMHLPRQRSARALQEITEPERVPTGGEHDLVGAVQDTDDGLACALEFRTDAYPPELVRRWAESFTVLLAGLLAEPHRRVGAVELLSAAERHRLLVERNDTAAGLGAASLADLVARQAARTPRAVAIESDRVRLNYAELIDRADRLAGRLAGHGVGPGRLVALAFGRSPAMVVALLAVHRAGAAYLPLDPQYPAERIRYLLDDAAPVLLVCGPGGSAPPETGVPRLVLDPLADDHGPPATPAPTRPRSVAHVMYTSGSTGRPKGVVVSHAGVAGLAEALVGRLGLGRGGRILQVGSPSFDITVGELCMAFHSGGTLVIPPPGPLAGDALGAVLRRYRITGTLITPGVMASVPPGDYPDLRVVCLGADACPPGLAAAWATDRRRVCNAYGPTEITCAATVSDPLVDAAGPPPIGRPITNTRVYVLDANLSPVPVGVPGELYLAGAGLAHGYLGRPGLTAERFVADPFGPPAGRMYRTSDVVRWREDGQLDFLGRTDDQVKLHGFRIEPAEVEAVLAGHGAVARAVVLVREDAPGRRRLVAYLVPRPGTEPGAASVLAHAARALPAHLVPSAVVTLETLPTTVHGKVDRAALPAPPVGPRPDGRAPGTAREETVCALVAEVLGVERVGAEDGFFELGGDSISAIQLVGRCRSAGLVLTVPEVFAARTPAALAALARVAPSREPDTGVGRFPLIPVMRWWREHASTVESFAMSALIRVPAGLDSGRVAAALRALVDRHDALRMRLHRHSQGEWELEVPERGDAGPAVTTVDARSMTADGLRDAAGRDAARAELSPEAGRMLAAVWYDRGPAAPGWLLLTIHHLAVDVVSWHILRRDLAAVLADGAAGPPPRTSVRRWARELHRHAARVADELPRWVRTLSAPDARLMDDRPAGGRRATVTVSRSAEPALTSVTTANRCGVADVLLTALLAAAVRRRGRGGGLLVELEGHGRHSPAGDRPGDDLDVSGTVGWFTALYPVLLDAGEAGGEAFWRGGAGPGLALGRVTERLAAVPAGGLGYGLLRHLNPDTAPKLADLPGPDVRFNYLGRSTPDAEAGMELLGAVRRDAVPLTHLIEVDTAVEGARLVATWSYPEGVLAEREVRRLAEDWFAALDALAEHAARDGAGGTGATGADFPLVRLTREQVEALEVGLDG